MDLCAESNFVCTKSIFGVRRVGCLHSKQQCSLRSVDCLTAWARRNLNLELTLRWPQDGRSMQPCFYPQVTECEVLVQAQFYYMDDACDSVGLLCSVLLTRFVTVCQTDTQKSFQFFFHSTENHGSAHFSFLPSNLPAIKL